LNGSITSDLPSSAPRFADTPQARFDAHIFARLISMHQTAMPGVSKSSGLRDCVVAYESGEKAVAATVGRIEPHCREMDAHYPAHSFLTRASPLCRCR
jgi:hypothetical protein